MFIEYITHGIKEELEVDSYEDNGVIFTGPGIEKEE